MTNRIEEFTSSERVILSLLRQYPMKLWTDGKKLTIEMGNADEARLLRQTLMAYLIATAQDKLKSSEHFPPDNQDARNHLKAQLKSLTQQ